MYVDNGVDGLELDRPALNRLQRDIADGLIGTVIVSNISRVGRNYIEVNNWINSIRRKGVSFTSVQDGITDNMIESQDVWFPRYHDYLVLANQPPN